MTKPDLLTWLSKHPRNQRRLERMTGLSHGYFTNMKKSGTNPSRATLNLIENAINEIKNG
jgi:hypothetical protein